MSASIEDIHIASHPTRFEILMLLAKRRDYPTKLEEQMKVQRRIISFHLVTLERARLVSSEFGLSSDKSPKAVRFYEITGKGKLVLGKIMGVIS
jgi:DNA-binding transcriptional ArsR family regulator